MKTIEKRIKEWNNMSVKEQLDNEFPPRICAELETLSFPEIEKRDNIKKSYYFWGKAGTGKTIRAAAFIQEILKRSYYEGKCPSVKFTTFSDILLEIRNTFHKQSNETEQTIIEKYREADWLVLDDFGASKDSDWTYQVLYSIINYRYEHLKPIIVTCNYSLEEITERLGDDRTTSRLASMCISIHMKTPKRKPL